jgi:hypothetical protein
MEQPLLGAAMTFRALRIPAEAGAMRKLTESAHPVLCSQLDRHRGWTPRAAEATRKLDASAGHRGLLVDELRTPKAAVAEARDVTLSHGPRTA